MAAGAVADLHQVGVAVHPFLVVEGAAELQHQVAVEVVGLPPILVEGVAVVAHRSQAVGEVEAALHQVL